MSPVLLGELPLDDGLSGAAIGVIAGARSSPWFRPPGGPMTPADLASMVLVTL